MQIVTDEPIKIISQLIIPIIPVLLTVIIPVMILRYLNRREKNQYIKLLKTHFPNIEIFLKTIKIHKEYIPVSLILGFFFGFVILLKLTNIFNTLLLYTLNLDYFQKLIPIFLDIGKLNFTMLFYSCFNIFILISLIILAFWFNFIKSKNLSKPQITSSGTIKTLSIMVYSSYWFFLGLLIGINFFIYFLLLINLYYYSIIDGNSFSWKFLSLLYTNVETNIQYLKFHQLMYMVGIVGSILYVQELLHEIDSFSKNLINVVTSFYDSNFPYIKIKTESGEVKGQLRDIRNKVVVTLSEKNELKIVPWDKIEIMEASHINNNESIILDKSSIK